MSPRAIFAHEASTPDAVFMTKREFMAFPIVATFTVDGEPVSKARARFTKYGSKTMVYTPEKTKTGEERVARAFRAAAPGWTPNKDNIYGVFGIFFAATFQRRDVDNMLKLILDGLNKVAWTDDAQVFEISGKKQVCPPAHERTAVLIYDMGPRPRNYFECIECGAYASTFPSWNGDKRFCSSVCSMKHTAKLRQRTCPTCGKDFEGSRTNRQQYCSPECGYEAKRTVVTCEHCSTPFSQQSVHVKAKNYCSSECRTAYLRAHPVKAAKGACNTCGAAVSRKEYLTCAACNSVGKAPMGRPVLLTITDIGGDS